MKAYKILNNVETTNNNIKEVEVNVDTTFVNKDLKPLLDDEENQIGWITGMQEWWKNEEYVEYISKENYKLKLELANSNMQNALLINELSNLIDVKLANSNMELANLLSQLKGGDI